jgi:hypothetical protein
MDKEFGMELERPFYLRTKLETGRIWRVVTAQKGDNLTLNQFKRNSENQQFFLDAETKTLKSVADKTKSWDIESKGKSRNVRLDTTNARWF